MYICITKHQHHPAFPTNLAGFILKVNYNHTALNLRLKVPFTQERISKGTVYMSKSSSICLKACMLMFNSFMIPKL